jgi:hypothetical protein
MAGTAALPTKSQSSFRTASRTSAFASRIAQQHCLNNRRQAAAALALPGTPSGPIAGLECLTGIAQSSSCRPASLCRSHSQRHCRDWVGDAHSCRAPNNAVDDDTAASSEATRCACTACAVVRGPVETVLLRKTATTWLPRSNSGNPAQTTSSIAKDARKRASSNHVASTQATVGISIRNIARTRTLGRPSPNKCRTRNRQAQAHRSEADTIALAR